MSIPTPSAIAKQATERKQRELQQQAEIEALEKKLDADSRSKSDRVRASRASASSPKGKARGTSSPSAKSGSTKKTERPSSAESEKTTPPSAPSTSAKSVVKKPFVRKPHLTQRLTDNEKLLELKASMPAVKHVNRVPSSKKSGTSTSSRKQRTDRKSSSSQSWPRKKTQKPNTSGDTPSSSKQS